MFNVELMVFDLIYEPWGPSTILIHPWVGSNH